ncbi:hypothetical protein O3G_MSEX004920 [Manduca sexta]|uniref:Biogenesis of lysosome-related organelles complex 1 subunit 5 n=1 Tax=Manduca sexta TaxID=7130 RepID=A0A921YXU4_MANSE|nr:hypothetical protein O3G_MSEX004920 [Manduca sexta]
MQKEFEEKRGDREVENLFNILEQLTEIKDSEAERIKKSGETGLPVFGEKLTQALNLLEDTEKDYLEFQKECEKKRAVNREKRQKEWDQFIDDMNFKCQRIDNAFEEKEEELRDLIAMQIDTEDNTEETEKIESEDDKDTQIKEENKEVGKDKETKTIENKDDSSNKDNNCKKSVELKCQEKERENEKFLTTTDIDWLYNYVYERRGEGNKKVPYLHELLKGVQVEMPNNKVIKRNPVLEARCVKLRAQQEAREYRKMTKSVDNVRMRFPEDSINYQLKQVNRQLIAIGQFIISIFAGFLFGFRGVEWMVGNLDFGFRLLLGVMCALVIALAEIYFLAKKLNEELNVPETVQLGGPPKFADDPNQTYAPTNKAIEKQHQD